MGEQKSKYSREFTEQALELMHSSEKSFRDFPLLRWERDRSASEEFADIAYFIQVHPARHCRMPS